MSKVTGQLLRLSGLLIELIGLIGVVRGTDGEATRIPLPGGTSVAPAWIAVVLGFAIWLLGTILIQVSRPSRSRPDPAPGKPNEQPTLQ